MTSAIDKKGTFDGFDQQKQNEISSSKTNSNHTSRNTHFDHRHELSTTLRNLANENLSSLKRNFHRFSSIMFDWRCERKFLFSKWLQSNIYYSSEKLNKKHFAIIFFIQTKFNFFHALLGVSLSERAFNFCTTEAREHQQQQQQKGRECDGKSAHKLCKNPLKVWNYRFFLYGIA